MKKRVNIIILIVAVVTLAPLGFMFLLASFQASFDVQATEKSHFSVEQIQAICEPLQFELAPGETLSTRFYPGMMQSPTSLRVRIHDIESEEAFLSRFRGKITGDNTRLMDSDIINSYHVELFMFPDYEPKDYLSHLTFYRSDEEMIATFYIQGSVPQLSAMAT